MFSSVSDPFNSALNPPGSDPVPETADPVPMGGLLQLCGEDSADHTGGKHTLKYTHTLFFIDALQLCVYTVYAKVSVHKHKKTPIFV